MIKSKLIYFILFIILLFTNNIKAEIYSINFVDIDKIINDSDIGATAISEIENRVKNKYDEFKKIDSDLKQKELEILNSLFANFNLDGLVSTISILNLLTHGSNKNGIIQFRQ